MEDVRIVEQTDTYIVVLKPAGMHTAPLRPGERGTLLVRLLKLFPEVAEVPGVKPVEPGLLHRLDRETSGLVLVARTASAFRHFTGEAALGRFLKYYTAVCLSGTVPGVPEWPFSDTLRAEPADRSEGPADPAESLSPAAAGCSALPACIVSGFRPYGPGRVRVAPVPQDRVVPERLYRTTIVSCMPFPGVEGFPGAGQPFVHVRVRLERGFRHQIRCHLAAAGFPIAGDPLYLEPGLSARFSRLHLYADTLEFVPPGGGPIRRVCVPADPVLP